MTDAVMRLLDQAVLKGKAGLRKVGQGVDLTIQGWVEYGQALLIGKKECSGNEEFSKWIDDNGLNIVDDNKLLSATEVTAPERAAALWAAEFPNQLAEMRDKYKDTRTVRGWHDKWRADQKSAVIVPLPVTTAKPPTEVLDEVIEPEHSKVVKLPKADEEKVAKELYAMWRDAGSKVGLLLDSIDLMKNYKGPMREDLDRAKKALFANMEAVVKKLK